MIGAIVIVGAERARLEARPSNRSQVCARPAPLACVELLGRSVLGRTIEKLTRSGIDFIKVCGIAPGTEAEKYSISFLSRDVWRDAEQRIADLKELGAEAVLILHLGAYVEFEAAQMLELHYQENAVLTRAFDQRRALDVWVLDPNQISLNQSLRDFLENEPSNYYPVEGYVNRLESARDIRRLIADSLGSRCEFRPQGFEVRPGVWMAPGAEVARSARIVAPAYVGRGAKIADQCLITRCSHVESNSQVDYGSAVEDSSVLSNTYVGIGLDLSHCVVDGNLLLNLRHDVMLEIADPAVLRRLREGKASAEGERRLLADLNFCEMAMSPSEQGRS